MRSKSNQSLKPVIPAEQLMEIVKKVISRYVAKGSIPGREAPDAEMSVFEKFWNNREKILSAFQGKSQLTTYCIAVANRMCCEFIRKEKKHWNQLHEAMETVAELNNNTNHFETEKNMHFKNEVKRLSNALQFFNGESAKFNLFLKYYLDIPINNEDIKKYHPQNIQSISTLLNQKEPSSKGEKFEQLAEVVNTVEAKNVKSDSVRMWLNSRMTTLLNRLNGNGITSHNHESLTILMELLDNKNHPTEV
ncbi:sigma-70 RNA polymerase sigma factor region 4 domain-containing protein [Marinilabilia sp.]